MSELLLINPRRRSKRRRKGRMPPALARYWASKGRRKLRRPKRSKARRRRRVSARKHPAMGYTIGTRKIRRRKLNPRRRRHASRFRMRRRHRNPRFGVPSVRGILNGTIMPAAIGAGGALALDVAYGYASPYLPAFFTNRWATLGVKILGAIGIGMVASKVLGRERGKVAALGAATVVVYGAAKSALSAQFPTIKGLSGYADFVDYSVGNRNGVGAYLPPGGMSGGVGFYSPAATVGGGESMGAYLQQPGLSGVEGYNWQSDGM